MESLVRLPSQGQKRVFFNEWCSTKYGGIRYLAIEDGVTPAPRKYPAPLLPPTPDLFSDPDGMMFLSTCALEGVVEMTLCRDSKSRLEPVIGILFRHRDRTTCVGQFRFDLALEVVPLGRSMDLYICLRMAATGQTYVAHVKTHAPDGPDRSHRTQWIHVPRDGVLEWWFSSGRVWIESHPS